MTRRVALIGGGVIGSGWAASCLARGAEVVVHDPDPDARRRTLLEIERALRATNGDVVDWSDRLAFVSSVAEAARGADFVQESGPETLDVKAEIVREIDEAAPARVVVASSSSTLMPSTLAGMAPQHPERVVVGHPFNPVHLMPLVEVVATPDTAPFAVAAALDHYTWLGKRPIHLQREVAGHVANRLQAALWREAYSLVESGVASVADIDAAVAHGPGLRWALLGPLVNQHLSGGAGGLAHVLAHLGPPTQAIMDDLGAPRLTPELVALLVAGVDDELAGIDQDELADARDLLLRDLLAAKTGKAVLP
ncbi:MAG: 3-hydroxyacyl-CoA dehydrogenase NAD-binding domain-containing protein [Nocardioides sp.]